MKWFRKPLLQWCEPKEFLRLADQRADARSRWWHQLIWVPIIALMLLVPWYLARFDPKKQPLPFEVVAWAVPLFSVTLVYAIPWLARFQPSEVRLFDKQILRMRGRLHIFLKYEDIRRFTWINGTEFNTLMLEHGRKGRVVCLGVPLELDAEHLTRLLCEHGIHQEMPGEQTAEALA